MTDLYTELLKAIEEGLRILNDVGLRFLGIILLFLTIVGALSLIAIINRFIEWVKKNIL